MFTLSNIVKSLFPQPYSCTFTSVENCKVSQKQRRATMALNEVSLESSQELSDRDLNHISAEQFNAAVKAFKLKFKIKSIKKFFAVNRSYLDDKFGNSFKSLLFNCLQSHLRDVFFADQVVNGYLSRHIIKTQGAELVFDSKYERSFYMAENLYHEIPFRTLSYTRKSHERYAILSDPAKAFYARGTDIEYRKYLYAPEDLKAESELYCNIKYFFTKDIYKLSRKAYSISKDFSPYQESSVNHNFTYFVFPGAKDDHAYLAALVFDSDTKKIVCSLIVNSWNRDSYFYFLKTRYETEAPFIDCSIDVQLDSDDRNCVLYSSNIGRALVKLLGENEEQSDSIFKTFQEDGDQTKVQEFIRTNIVKYLPEYFYQDENQVYQRRSGEELRDFHMKVRWKLGNRYIQERSELAQQRLQERKITTAFFLWVLLNVFSMLWLFR